ncbi:MAG: AraC family transcriptional regulator [Gammaproteobacteria bacterium]
MTRLAKVSRRFAPSAPARALPALRLQSVQAEKAASAVAEASFKGMRVQQVTFAPGAAYEFAWKGRSHYLSYLDMQLADGETFGGSAPRRLPRDLRGKLSFIPSGEQVWGWSVVRPPYNSFTAVYFEPDALDEELGKRMERATRSHLHFEDPALRETMRKLHATLAAASQGDSLYLEALCVLCAMEMGRYVEGAGIGESRKAEQRDVARVSRARDLIEANLAGNVTLGQLADAAGLSRFHFLRSFKRGTGETPHQYLLRRRIEKAQLLLREETMTVEAVAAATGFSSSTRFIRAFRLRTGATPGSYREASARKSLTRR